MFWRDDVFVVFGLLFVSCCFLFVVVCFCYVVYVYVLLFGFVLCSYVFVCLRLL